MKQITKLNSLSELVDEIDTWIDILQNKKKILMYTAQQEDSAINCDAPNFENNCELIRKFERLLNTSKRDKSNKSGFTSYSVNVNREYYDMLKKVAKEADQSISTFLKKKYLYYIIENKDHPKYIANEYERFRPTIENLKQKDKPIESVAIAVDYNDNQGIESMAKKACLRRARDIIKLCIAQFVSDCMTGKVSEKQDYKYLSDDIQFKKCDSTNLSGYYYDQDKCILYIEFIGGGVYSYENVPDCIYFELDRAESKGKYFNMHIRDNKNFSYKKVR